MPPTRPIEVRFSEKFSVDTKTQCWNWTGAKSRGYGYLGRQHQTSIAAHKFSYLHHVGRIPKGMLVLHRCNNSLCVNPSHLKLGTHADNMADMKRAGTRVGRNSGTTLNSAQIKTMKRLLANGLSQKQVAQVIGVNRTTVQRTIYSGRIESPPGYRKFLSEIERAKVIDMLKSGQVPILQIAKHFSVDRKTVRNIRDRM